VRAIPAGENVIDGSGKLRIRMAACRVGLGPGRRPDVLRTWGLMLVRPDSSLEILIAPPDRAGGLVGTNSVQPEHRPIVLAQIGRLG
jgi:hypothetical protein